MAERRLAVRRAAKTTLLTQLLDKSVKCICGYTVCENNMHFFEAQACVCKRCTGCQELQGKCGLVPTGLLS